MFLKLDGFCIILIKNRANIIVIFIYIGKRANINRMVMVNYNYYNYTV